MNSSHRRGAVLVVLAGPALALLGAAWVAQAEQARTEQTETPQAGAQQARVQEAGAEAGAGIQEIIVTAQKRTENVQNVPVSVTALTAAQLAETKMDTPSDLAAQIPNLQVNGIVGEGSPLFSLRGVSMFDYSLSQSSPVASYIDEVYKGNFVLFGVEMYDLERVEVLRGPQGTLYGKNTTGGAINFITHKPGFSDEAYVKLGFGNYNRREVAGAVQGALIQGKLAARLAFTYTKADGFVRNILPGHPDLEGIDQYGVRLSFLYKATDALDLTLRLSKSMQDPQNYAIIAGCVTPPILSSCVTSSPGVGFTGYYRTNNGTLTGAPLAANQIAQDYTPRRRQDNEAVSLTANWTLSDAVALTSITSWDEGALFNPEGTDGSPVDVFKIPYIGKTRQVTQDLRLTSSNTGPFNYIAGAYYQHEIIFNSTENRFFSDPMFAVTGDYHDCANNSFGPGVGYSVGSLINVECLYYNQFDQLRNTWAAYSDASYQLAPTVKLRAGIRYNHDNGAMKNALSQLRGNDGVPIGNIIPGGIVNGQYAPLQALPGSPNYDAIVNATTSQALHNTAVTGRAGIDFTPTKDSLLYLSYSRGYRSAAFNAQFFFSNADFTAVRPETIDAVEAGFKTTWLDNRLQLDGAVFHYQYKDQQFIDVYATGQQPLINLPKSKIDGGELEIIARPVRSVTLRAGVGILHTEVQEASIHEGGATLTDISGRKLPYAPSFSGTLSGDWEALASGSAGLRLHVDGSYSSKEFFELLNEERLAQAAYSLINARLTLHSQSDKWEVSAWGRNLADKLYYTNEVDLLGLGFDYRHRGEPRMYGVEGTYRF